MCIKLCDCVIKYYRIDLMCGKFSKVMYYDGI